MTAMTGGQSLILLGGVRVHLSFGGVCCFSQAHWLGQDVPGCVPSVASGVGHGVAWCGVAWRNVVWRGEAGGGRVALVFDCHSRSGEGHTIAGRGVAWHGVSATGPATFRLTRLARRPTVVSYRAGPCRPAARSKRSGLLWFDPRGRRPHEEGAWRGVALRPDPPCRQTLVEHASGTGNKAVCEQPLPLLPPSLLPIPLSPPLRTLVHT